MDMQKIVENPTRTKIKTFSEIQEILEKHRHAGQKVVQCHGVFDLLHPGHIRHFKAAKELGDILVVTVTPDRFVNKGPGRPAFTEQLRIESVAALEDIDFVVLNNAPDAISAIQKIRPSIYVKGMEYANHEKDVTGKISKEMDAVQEAGGHIHYTDDIVFSSSNLINRFIDTLSPNVQAFVDQLKKSYSIDKVMKIIEDLYNLRVLIIGDAIIDEYQYSQPLGQSGKGLHMCARCLEKEVFLGGSLIIANHVAQFSNHVNLLTAVGKECPHLNFIRNSLDKKVNPEFIYLEDTTTLTKKRYVLKDGKSLSKLFETYSGCEDSLNEGQTDHVIKYLNEHADSYDLIIACDFGNGFTNTPIINTLSGLPAFLALNTQTNSGNRGYNVITNYRRADFISLNEPELRLASHNRVGALEGIATDICQILHCPLMAVTRGVNGVFCYSALDDQVDELPALASSNVDRVGAGDSFLSLSSLSLAKVNPFIISAFLGSLAAAMSVQIVGNAEAINKVDFCKFVTRILK